MKITDKNTARRYQRDNITSYLLTSEEAAGAKHITTSLVEMAKGGKQHRHSHETEQCYFILEGRGRMTVGKETEEVTAGMSVFIPSHTPHDLVNTNEQALRYLSRIAVIWERAGDCPVASCAAQRRPEEMRGPTNSSLRLFCFQAGYDLLIARHKHQPSAVLYDTHGGVEEQYKLRLLIFTI